MFASSPVNHIVIAAECDCHENDKPVDAWTPMQWNALQGSDFDDNPLYPRLYCWLPHQYKKAFCMLPCRGKS